MGRSAFFFRKSRLTTDLLNINENRLLSSILDRPLPFLAPGVFFRGFSTPGRVTAPLAASWTERLPIQTPGPSETLSGTFPEVSDGRIHRGRCTKSLKLAPANLSCLEIPSRSIKGRLRLSGACCTRYPGSKNRFLTSDLLYSKPS